MKLFALALSLPLALAACSPAAETESSSIINNQAQPLTQTEQAEPNQSNTIVDVAVANPDFSTLVTALQTAGLVDALSGPGPFTVFAPTDAAFAKLPAGTVEALLNDPAELTKILTYHVVEGQVGSAQVVNLDSATTLQGGEVSISVKGQDVMINTAKVISADVPASNGIIHVIDTVLLPQ